MKKKFKPRRVDKDDKVLLSLVILVAVLVAAYTAFVWEDLTIIYRGWL